MMGPAEDAPSYVHLGFWVNQSKGGFLGLTLTTSPTCATLLTNLMALFVTMAGGQFWTILRFSLHQIRAYAKSSTHDTGNLEHHRQQVVLRNTTTATATAQSLIQLGWASRKAPSASRRFSTFPIVALAVFSAIFFIVAGAFSNIVTDAGSDVLSRSPFCGFFKQSYLNKTAYGGPITTAQDEAMVAEFHGQYWHDIVRSLQYAAACYFKEGAGSSNCDTFKKSSLPFTTFHNGSCPFQSKICLEGVDTVIFDTGPIDTHNDFGINAAPADRLTYRRVANCTVLNGTSYSTGWVKKSDDVSAQPTWQIANVSYGYSLFDRTNDTYSYSNFADFYTSSAADWLAGYSLGSDLAFGVAENPSQSTFQPIPELEQTDADLWLFFLSYSGNYLEPIDDPWFAAHQPYKFLTSAMEEVTTYTQDTPISTIGCTEQSQICTDATTCTPLLGFDQIQDYIPKHLTLTPKQNITFNQLIWFASGTDLFETGSALALVGSPLLALFKRQNGYHTSTVQLPIDQWKQELTNWMAVGLAQLQRLMVESETGQIAAKLEYLAPPETDSEKWICRNLMIRSNVYQSFSVLALAIVIFVGTSIIVLSLTIEPLSLWLFRRIGRDETSHEIWRDHDMLGPQLWRSKLPSVETLEGRPTSSSESIASQETLPSYHSNEGGKQRAGTVAGANMVASQMLSVAEKERILIEQAYREHGYKAWVI